MGAKGPEILSTARPTGLRLAGFVALSLGGMLLGLGALLSWATVGFPGDLRGTLDVQTRGTDVWEGKAVLAVAVATLAGMVLMRLLSAPRTRRAIAVAILAFGLGAAALATWDALRAQARFGGTGALDEISRGLSAQLDRPYDVIRAQVREQFGAALRVDLEPGIFLAIVGGFCAAAGGTLSIAWANRQRVHPAETPAAPGPGRAMP